MKATGSWIWAALALCAALVLGSMTWLTRHVIGSERERAVAEARADLQERMRLALWRMDAAGAAIIVEENQRPASEAASPSTPAAEVVKMRFEISESGGVSAWQGEENIPALKTLLREQGEGAALFPAVSESLKAGRESWEAKKEAPKETVLSKQKAPRKAAEEQEYYNDKERAVRSKAVDNQVNIAQAPVPVAGPARAQPQSAADDAPATFASQLSVPSPRLVEVGAFRPAWIGGQLFLLRKLVWDSSAPLGGKTIQGVWMETDRLKLLLLKEIGDLLPAATLVASNQTAPDGMVLASFPWRLEPCERALPAPLPRPIVISLATGWAAAVLAIVAAAVLVRGILRLSERRASFVSAVTHELRTPLTTFRLYSDMLETGAVKEEKRGDYLRVLSHEADRLSHLVENVLAFSRIERGSARTATRQTSVRELLEPFHDRFAARLASAGLKLEWDLSDVSPAPLLRTDAAAVEHVLFNLVDNAAKYATGGNPPVVRLDVVDHPRDVVIRVRDHGPGIPGKERRKIFRAFHKSAREAAETKPGVGLGLALSRRLARSLGGDLVCEESPEGKGARFALILPKIR
ncbi:MAG TPA: HAMP domain-containing sensor histidine kinase [Luteolibacter sp.]